MVRPYREMQYNNLMIKRKKYVIDCIANKNKIYSDRGKKAWAKRIRFNMIIAGAESFIDWFEALSTQERQEFFNRTGKYKTVKRCSKWI